MLAIEKPNGDAATEILSGGEPAKDDCVYAIQAAIAKHGNTTRKVPHTADVCKKSQRLIMRCLALASWFI
jgi:hypothetical protein